MRRNLMLVLAAVSLTGGCSKGFSANSEVVTSVEGQDLKAQWIADIMHTGRRQGMIPSLRLSEYLADLWVDMSLFGQAAAADKLSDSTTIADAMWFVTLRYELAHWNDSLIAQRIKVPEAAIDSAIKANEWRVPQHILVQIPQGATAADKAAAKKKAEGLLAQIRGGKKMSDLVAANSDDPGSKDNLGFYGASPKGRWTPEFDKVLWELKPGQVSGLVATSYGYHIIRRADDAETAAAMVKLRGEVKDSLASRDGEKMSADYVTELVKTKDLQVDKQAATIVKGSLDDLDSKRNDRSKLATWKGGAFTVSDFVRWLQVGLADPNQGPGMIDELKGSPDSIINDRFIKNLATNQMLQFDAHEHKVGLTKADWDEEKLMYMMGVDTLKAQMGIDAATMKLSGSARTKAVGDKITEYFINIQNKKVPRLQPPPGFLAYVLRGRTRVRFNPDGMQKAVDLATVMNAADSTNNGPDPMGALKGADGPPPVQVGKPDSGKPGVKKP